MSYVASYSIALIAYLFTVIILTIVGWRKLVKPLNSGNKDFFTLAIHKKEESYILAGFGLTALSIFIVFKSEVIIPFISLSFAFSIISSILSQFQTHGIFPWWSSKLDGASVLSLISGFMMHFQENETVLGIFLMTILAITILLFWMLYIDANDFTKKVKHVKKRRN